MNPEGVKAAIAEPRRRPQDMESARFSTLGTGTNPKPRRSFFREMSSERDSRAARRAASPSPHWPPDGEPKPKCGAHCGESMLLCHLLVRWKWRLYPLNLGCPRISSRISSKSGMTTADKRTFLSSTQSCQKSPKRPACLGAASHMGEDDECSLSSRLFSSRTVCAALRQSRYLRTAVWL